MMMRLDGLPGEELVQAGLTDLAQGIESPEALLVEIARPRLSRLGIFVPGPRLCEAELTLYELLRREHPRDAYGRYNSLLRRLVSFGRAAEQRWARERDNREAAEQPRSATGRQS